MPNLELVIWQDAWFDFDEPEEERDDYLVHTVGWVIREGPRYISVAQEQLPEPDGFRAVTHIPLQIIKDRMVLERGVGRATERVG